MAADAVTQMQAMLARVRPVGMTDSAAREWLAVAVGDVRHLPLHVLAGACQEAKGKVKFHGEIIPAVLGAATVRSHELHEREIKRLQRDGHMIEGRAAPALEDRRGGMKKIGHLKLVEHDEHD